MRINKRACLCCGRKTDKPGPACTGEAEAREATQCLRGLGYTADDLLTKHRAQLDSQAPGLAEWIKKIALT